MQRQAVSSQWATNLAATTASSGRAAWRRRSSEPSSSSARNRRSRPEQHGEEGRDPDDAGGEARQLGLVGADGEGDDGADHDEEQHQRQHIAAGAGGKAQVAQRGWR